MIDDTIGNAMTMQPGKEGVKLGRIDQYELVRELGGGGFGTVFLAKDTVSGIEVAVKGLPPLVRNNREELENVRSNFALVAKLHHPNIAAALVLHPATEVSYASEDVRQKLRVLSGDFLMVMEYAPGVTLSQWRRQFPGNKVPLAQALGIVRQIASAIDYAHERRIVHRDIKPANVMMETTADGKTVARVLDFGLAAEIRSSMGRMSREIRDTSGTRPYMAPEQWLGGKQGPATDQYALAVLFHELITGEVPFSAVFDTGDPVVMMNVVGREPFAPPSVLARPVRLALGKALAKKPEERFTSCGDFVAALEGRRPKVLRRDAETWRRGSPGKALGVFALLAALGAVGYYGWTKYDAHVKAQKAEAARFRQQVYELKGKASQAREKNVKEEWHDWPHFSQRAKELEGAFRAGESAFEKDDYEVAKMQFQKVRDTWYWLSSNKVERTKADGARQRADASRFAAESAQAVELAVEAYSAASNSLMRAGLAFASGEFCVAVEEFGAAGKAFDRAASLAKNEGERRAAEKKKADTKASLAAFRAKPPRYEDGFRLAQTADQDNSSIQFYLGVCYDFGYGVSKDEAEAVKWYRKAAEQGDAIAQYNLGNMYKNGRGVAKDEAEAVKWYRKAVEQGHATSQYNLGVMYANGWGVSKDDAEAVKWYRKAAEQGHASAQYNLGVRYDNGRGVAKDEAEAVKWYRKAAEQGDEDAKAALKRRGY